jgi:F-type H+-transporting ATPase subunit b
MRKIQDSRFKIQGLKTKVFVFSLVNAHCLLFTVVAFAAEEAEHSFTFWDWFWPIVNFSILVAILVKFLAKPAREYFKKRTEMIEKSIKEAEEAKEIAKKSLEEVKERLKHADREIEEIKESARRSGEKEKEALIIEGDRMKTKIIEQARANIELELKKAKEAIKSEAALLALELAEKQIKETLGKKEHEAILDEYISKLSK